MKAYLRERENHWHIRYRDQHRKEFVESFAKEKFSKEDIQAKIDNINYKIRFQEYDPWQQKKKKKKDKRRNKNIGLVVEEFIQANQRAGKWLPNTAINYERILGLIVEDMMDLPLYRLDENKLQVWLNNKDIEPLSKLTYARKANTFLKWLYEHNYIDYRWKLSISNLEQKKLRNNDKVKYLTYDEVDDICRARLWQVQQYQRLKFVGEDYDIYKYPDAWWFMFWQMLRRSELPKIKVKDVDMEHNKVRIHGKGDKVDWIYIVPPAQKILKRRLEHTTSGPVFGIAEGSSRLYTKFRDTVGLALGESHASGLHQLRHGGAVHYLTLGKQPQFVSKMLRHETIEVTLRVYADILDQKLDHIFSDVSDQSAL